MEKSVRLHIYLVNLILVKWENKIATGFKSKKPH